MGVGLPLSTNEAEESIPLTRSEDFGGEYKGRIGNGKWKGKGKERAVDEDDGRAGDLEMDRHGGEVEERIFDVGDSDEEEGDKRS